MSLQGQQQPLVFERGVRLGDMQRQLCSAFAKRYPLSQVGMIIGERAFVEFLERPLLHVTDGDAIEVVFTRVTDMKHVDLCFRGQRRSFEEDMREPDAKGAWLAEQEGCSGRCMLVGVRARADKKSCVCVHVLNLYNVP